MPANKSSRNLTLCSIIAGVTDRRVPKRRGAVKKAYCCPICGREKNAYLAPKCPEHREQRMRKKPSKRAS